MPRTPTLADYLDYAVDVTQRSILFWDTMRQRGNEYLQHNAAGKPPLLKFGHELLLDGRTLEHPANYALLRILPRPDDLPTDEAKRPFVVVDPRAGHGPGIGGFKEDSEIGNALKVGHPVYFITFLPDPVPGQRLLDVALAEARFLELVRQRHPEATSAPCIIGNCQAGWAIMGLAALRPDLPGPLLLAGSPLSYWAGAPGLNPMRYSGGLLGGSWLAYLASDLGHGRFDGANLVLNFEAMNPGNTWWSKYYSLLDKADTEPPRFLEFERWWGGYFLMNREEITAIVDQLFVGNQLARGEIASADGKLRLDLRQIRSPICVLCSWGDDITPPQQALNWILDIYASDDDLLAQGQTIVYSVHPKVGHLGIFVSGSVARKEHAGFVELLDLIEALPPGLYEMLIEDKRPEMRGAQLVPDRYVTRFERRSITDITELCGDRSGERPFEVVRRVSEVNAGLYDELMAPVVQSLASEPAAELSRRFHPLRAQRWALSDLNPALLPFASAAPAVKAARRPCADDNPYRVFERDMAAAVERGWEAAAELRDRMAELTFNAIYASPLARAAAGLASAPDPQPLGADPVRRELARREAKDLLASADKGSLRDGIVRILLLLLNEGGAIDERSYRALQAVRQQLPKHHQASPAEMREVARRQALLLRADREAAVRGLTAIFSQPKDRSMAEAVLRKAAEAVGAKIDMTPKGPMAVLLNEPEPSAKAG
ncbi:DUF3141 domain-containing protein [Roseomonas sp. M0104]|uniref:DUF3141 domain-containing protein n=1 Tax=Teichococcus coralli TaxID=2545983 RepID=A0A845BLD1_9PROT|nr:DUF3141 domain-containing protein [Pseudoroseomonas coralli]MXP66057.1 DUF3141 domain-containing protein [Pseudoroseomonas coralli]